MPYFPMIKGGIDTSDATATADKIFKGYTAYVNGTKIIGSYNPYPLKSFSEATDTEITQMLDWARNGNISYDDLVSAGWTVGAERPVHLSAMSASYVGESHVAQDQTWVILHGKDFFDLNSGGKNLFVVGLKNCLTEKGYINNPSANNGGWNSCSRRSWCNSVFKNAIPSEELNWFKQFKVKTSSGNKSTSIITSTDWFSLPSRAEVFGSSYSSLTPEGEGTAIFDYYTISSHRAKNISGDYRYYWLRSPYVNGVYAFCCVPAGGYLVDTYASNNVFAVAPFGCF